ncbi:MAG TPA: heavy-metal-associated domain-containing protein [Pyrinomonadaceae bacterium]|nr:heavy-metal-associated domain-containing protein [Pyrinomonadaceae bacterium]
MKRKQVIALIVFTLVLGLGALSVSAATKTVTIRVEGMHCGGCSGSVTKALKATNGVEDVQVSYEKGEAIVKYDDQKVTVAKLREVINSTGFKAVEEKSAKN